MQNASNMRVPCVLHAIIYQLTRTPSQVSHLKLILCVQALAYKTKFISYNIQQANREKHFYTVS